MHVCMYCIVLYCIVCYVCMYWSNGSIWGVGAMATTLRVQELWSSTLQRATPAKQSAVSVVVTTDESNGFSNSNRLIFFSRFGLVQSMLLVAMVPWLDMRGRMPAPTKDWIYYGRNTSEILPCATNIKAPR